jgi:hypothetical protein
MDAEYVPGQHRHSGLSPAERGEAVFREFAHAARSDSIPFGNEGARYMIRVLVEAIEAAENDADDPDIVPMPPTTELVNTIYKHIVDDDAVADIVRIVARERISLLTKVAKLDGENHRLKDILKASVDQAKELLTLMKAS